MKECSSGIIVVDFISLLNVKVVLTLMFRIVDKKTECNVVVGELSLLTEVVRDVEDKTIVLSVLKLNVESVVVTVKLTVLEVCSSGIIVVDFISLLNVEVVLTWMFRIVDKKKECNVVVGALSLLTEVVRDVEDETIVRSVLKLKVDVVVVTVK